MCFFLGNDVSCSQIKIISFLNSQVLLEINGLVLSRLLSLILFCYKHLKRVNALETSSYTPNCICMPTCVCSWHLCSVSDYFIFRTSAIWFHQATTSNYQPTVYDAFLRLLVVALKWYPSSIVALRFCAQPHFFTY